jgi:hypothetical protein
MCWRCNQRPRRQKVEDWVADTVGFLAILCIPGGFIAFLVSGAIAGLLEGTAQNIANITAAVCAILALAAIPVLVICSRRNTTCPELSKRHDSDYF